MPDVIYVGSNGFPFGSATVQRQLYIAKAIELSGKSVLIVCNKGVHQKGGDSIQWKGEAQGISYIYSSGTSYYPKSIFVRNALKIVGTLFEFLLVVWNRMFGGTSVLLVNTINLNWLRYYNTLGKFLGLKVVYDYVENIGSLKITKSTHKHFDNVVGRYCDQAFYISNQLKLNLKESNPSIPIIKVPPLTDYQFFSTPIKTIDRHRPFFLFCAVGYLEVFRFVMDSYELLPENGFDLVLIASGTAAQREQVESWAKASKKADRITVLSRIPINDLIAFYNQAHALLIPLRNNQQDKARFPHKISEYLATGNPIITTNIGEVRNYLKDGVSALIAENYDVSQFAERMLYSCEQRESAREIGHNGKKVGEANFDYNAYSTQFQNFIP